MADPVSTADIDVSVSKTGLKRTYQFVSKTASNDYQVSWVLSRPLRITSAAAATQYNPLVGGAACGALVAVTPYDTQVPATLYAFKTTVALSWTQDGRDNQILDMMIPTGSTIAVHLVNYSDDADFVSLILQAEEYEDPGLFQQVSESPCGFINWLLGRCP